MSNSSMHLHFLYLPLIVSNQPVTYTGAHNGKLSDAYVAANIFHTFTCVLPCAKWLLNGQPLVSYTGLLLPTAFAPVGQAVDDEVIGDGGLVVDADDTSFL